MVQVNINSLKGVANRNIFLFDMSRTHMTLVMRSSNRLESDKIWQEDTKKELMLLTKL